MRRRRPGPARPAWTTVRPLIGATGNLRHQTSDRDHRTADQAQLAAHRADLERERALVAKLQELDAVRDAFVANISHELRTPLTSILGFLHLVTSGEGSLSDSDRTRMLGIVEASSQELLVLVDDLLTLSRIEEGMMVSLDRSVVDLAEVLLSAHAALTADATRVDVVLPAAQDVSILGDAVQLCRAVVNVLSNAVKFTPPDGSITMVAEQHLTTVQVTITDTGIGIPAAEQGELFSRFFRSSISQQHQTTGAGLGLVIAAGIVRGHGGSVQIESLEGTGTTVRFELPLHLG